MVFMSVRIAALHSWSAIAGYSTRNDAIHHHAMTEAPGIGAENVLADECTPGLDGDDAGVVADRAHIAHMVRKTLQLGHDAAQHLGPRRNIPAQRLFHGLRERETIGDRAISGDPRGDFGRLIDRSACAERLYALVHIAEPLFEADDCLPVGSKPEMARLDNAGVNGAHRNLMQAHAFDGQEAVPLFVSRWPAWPHAMVEPGPVVGQPDGICAVKVAHRPFQPHRGRMMKANRRIGAILHRKGKDGSPMHVGSRQSHVHPAVIEPKRAEVVPAQRRTLCKGLSRAHPSPQGAHSHPARRH